MSGSCKQGDVRCRTNARVPWSSSTLLASHVEPADAGRWILLAMIQLALAPASTARGGKGKRFCPELESIHSIRGHTKL
eukprot:scaffold100_cov323-Pavlova_lutheri.AAC.23